MAASKRMTSGKASAIECPVRDSSAGTAPVRATAEAVVLELEEPAVTSERDTMRDVVAKIGRLEGRRFNGRWNGGKRSTGHRLDVGAGITVTTPPTHGLGQRGRGE